MTTRTLLAVIAAYWLGHIGVAVAQGAYPIAARPRPTAEAR